MASDAFLSFCMILKHLPYCGGVAGVVHVLFVIESMRRKPIHDLWL